jgi:hypothetical protein
MKRVWSLSPDTAPARSDDEVPVPWLSHVARRTAAAGGMNLMNTNAGTERFSVAVLFGLKTRRAHFFGSMSFTSCSRE